MSDAFGDLFHNNYAVDGEKFIAKKPGAEYPMMYSGKPPLTWGQYEPGVMADTPEAVAEDKRKHDFHGSPADQAFIQQMQEQPEGSQITDEAWIGASKRLYHYMNPTSQAQTEELAKYNLTPISSESFTDEDYANWGVNFMSKFNYNITAMLFDVNKLSGAPSEVAASMYYMMETADRDGLLLENFKRGFSNFMTDPTTYVGLSTLGIGMVGTQSGKQLSKMAFKDVLKNIVVNRGGSAAAVAGVEGAAFSAVDDAARQGVKMNAGQQEEFAGGQNALSMAAGAVLGNRLAAGLPAVGETVMRTAQAIPDVVSAVGDELTSGAMYGNPIFAVFDAVKKAYDANPNDPEIKAEYTKVWTERNRALSAEQPNTDHRGSHQPSGPEDENPVRLDNVSISTNGESAGYPSDFYGANGAKYYAPGPRFSGDEFGIANQESYTAIIAAKDNPDAEVTIYRAVPNDDSITTINRGDFVTLSPKYAELHGSSGYGQSGDDAGKVISETVKVKDIYFAGDDVNEFGYFPDVQISKEAIGKTSTDAGFTTNTTDASSTFGEGAVYKTYTDPASGGLIRVVQRKDGSASVLDLEVPEESQGKGIGQALQAAAMEGNPVLTGQVSSKAAATTAYRLGRRPSGQPDATLDEVFAIIDDMSSVNLVSPAAQPNEG